MDLNEATIAPVEKRLQRDTLVPTILLILGIVLCWVPVVGAGLCVSSLILRSKSKKKGLVEKQGKHTILLIITSIVLVIALIAPCITIAIFASKVSNDKTPQVKEYVENRVANHYDGAKCNSSNLSVKEEGNTFYVTGKATIYIEDYATLKKETYKVSVDFVIAASEENENLSVKSDNSVYPNTPDDVSTIPEAIDQINTKTATEKAEEEFHKRVQLKNEDSYTLNDTKVTAEYKEDGSIYITVRLDYSAQNGFGGMNRESYTVYLLYSNGQYKVTR